MYLTILQICKHTQEEYIAKRSVNQLKAYEMSQKQLFSDEHETLDSRLLHIIFYTFQMWSYSSRGSSNSCASSDLVGILNIISSYFCKTSLKKIPFARNEIV